VLSGLTHTVIPNPQVRAGVVLVRRVSLDHVGHRGGARGQDSGRASHADVGHGVITTGG
jgi:hypothetical protein